LAHHPEAHPARGHRFGCNRCGGLQQALGKEVVDEDPDVIVVKGQQLGPGELRSRQLTSWDERIPLGLEKEGPAFLEEGEEDCPVGQQTLQGPLPPLLLKAELLEQTLIEQRRELLLA